MKQYILVIAVIMAAFGMAGCAQKTAEGPMVKVMDGNAKGYTVRWVSADNVNEDYYIKRGYFKNTDLQGNVMFIKVPATDVPPVDFDLSSGNGREIRKGRKADKR